MVDWGFTGYHKAVSNLEHAIAGMVWFEPFKFVFWVILAHFKLYRNKEMKFLLVQNLFIITFWFKFWKIQDTCKANHNPENMMRLHHTQNG